MSIHQIPHFRLQPQLARSMILTALILLTAATAPAMAQGRITEGCLQIIGANGAVSAVCPLEKTTVTADVAGYFARVMVQQKFVNNTDSRIEAVYVFPLPNEAAVDDMEMEVGDRIVIAEIKRREEARQVYEAAKAAGHVASLLDQERPNIFTQSIANIAPGESVSVRISYVETLRFEDGAFEFVFPMVVGPRYTPQSDMPMRQGDGNRPGGRIVTRDDSAKFKQPPVTPEGTRAGHNIDIVMTIDAGMPISRIDCTSHEIVQRGSGGNRVEVALKDAETIPNKDFILRYRTTTDEISDSVVTHVDERGGYFTIMLAPPQRVVPQMIVPRELIFVIDTSGSMHGFPMEKSREVMKNAIAAMNPADTFNIITFAGDTAILWEAPRPATQENRNAAWKFLETQKGRGGTEMMKAIDAALVQTSIGETIISAAELPSITADGRTVTIRVSAAQMKRIADPGVTPGLITMDIGNGATIAAQAGQFADFETLFARREVREWTVSGTWNTTADGTRLNIDSAVPYDGNPAGPMRIVAFLTDGYVSNDMAIIDAVRKNAATTRVFSFGIGSSVNRFLLDNMALAGRGDVEFVTLESSGAAAVERFVERIAAPVLTDISVDWNGAPVADVCPQLIPDLFSTKPVAIRGRYKGSFNGVVTLRGNTADGPFARSIKLDLPPTTPGHPAIASLWARGRIGEIMFDNMGAFQSGNVDAGIKEAIIGLGIEYRLMTQFTNFVAVERLRVIIDGELKTIPVPVEMPDGVSYEGMHKQKEMARGGRGGPRTRAALGAVGAPPPAGAAPAREVKKDPQVRELMDEAEVDEDGRQAAERYAIDQKLDVLLRKLAERVARDGTDGNLSMDGLVVKNNRVQVTIQLSLIDDELREALKTLGVVIHSEASAVVVVIATVPVDKLEDVAAMTAVRSVKPLK